MSFKSKTSGLVLATVFGLGVVSSELVSARVSAVSDKKLIDGENFADFDENEESITIINKGGLFKDTVLVLFSFILGTVLTHKVKNSINSTSITNEELEKLKKQNEEIINECKKLEEQNKELNGQVSEFKLNIKEMNNEIRKFEEVNSSGVKNFLKGWFKFVLYAFITLFIPSLLFNKRSKERNKSAEKNININNNNTYNINNINYT